MGKSSKKVKEKQIKVKEKQKKVKEKKLSGRRD